MKDSEKPEKLRNFQHLIVACIILLIIPATDWYGNWCNKPAKLLLDFRKEILKVEEELKIETGVLFKSFKSKSPGPENCQLVYKAINSEKPGISLFVFRNDSLLCWGSNREIFQKGFANLLKEGFQAVHLQNGWYGFYLQKKGSLKFIAGSLIKTDFSITNSYLKNSFSAPFTLPESVSLTADKTGNPVFSADKKYLFSLLFSANKENKTGFYGSVLPLNKLAGIWLLIFFLLGYYFLFLSVFGFCRRFRYFQIHKIRFLLFFITGIVILRAVQFYFQFPAQLYQTELFSKAWYSSSWFLPSLGEYLINSFIVLWIAVLLGKIKTVSSVKTSNAGWGFFRYQILLLIVVSLVVLFEFLITDLVINSSFPLNFENIADLIPPSYYGLIILISLSGALLLISGLLLNMVFAISINIEWLITGLTVSVFLFVFAGLSGVIEQNYITILFYSIGVCFFWYMKTRKNPRFSLKYILFLVFFIAILATGILNRANTLKENDRLNLYAISLSSRQNPVAEDRYDQIVGKLRSDPVLKKMILFESPEVNVADSINVYLKRNYFNDYWRRYNIQVTLCRPGQDLRVQPQGYLIDCNMFFRNLINRYGETTSVTGLYYLDYGYGKEYYLALLNPGDSNTATEKQSRLYLEFTLSGTTPDPGYPGLLLDENRVDAPGRSNYAYALYQHGRLVHFVGNVNYLLELEKYPSYSSVRPYFFDDGLKHFYFRMNDGFDILISKPGNVFLSVITPFSYLFILYAILALGITGFNMLKKGIYSNPVDLRTKLQISLTGILILTMVIIGLVQVIYIININEKKNRDYLREKAYSVLTEVQHKFGSSGTVSDVVSREPENFLIKLSNIFFSDINFYDARGFLITSSRPEIFREGLIAERMNTVAYQKMIIEHNSMLIQDEMIGAMKFGSAYLPMHNDQGNLLGYINLPYFARQDDLKREISSFLVTFVNIYILLILFGALILFLLSNYITSPLALLSAKMSLLRLGKPNEKIAWKNNDEIGRLVADYNRMIDELENSANQLARNERESAWREMARQVAHEIKNPLTPMKLSAQYLQKSWNEHAPDMDQRIARFTRTLVGQIDALADIATGFSDFARMPAPKPELLKVEDVIKTVLTWYPESTGIRYVFESGNTTIEILADRSQLTRVLTNLINNAVQAIDSRKDGLIMISLNESPRQLIIEVSDNGAGIPADRASKIFQPDFTTKTGGMGLGLAIVKGIIMEMKGEISFTSDEKTGTTFTIRLPINIQNSDDKLLHD